jgi:hypothetical protein
MVGPTSSSKQAPTDENMLLCGSSKNLNQGESSSKGETQLEPEAEFPMVGQISNPKQATTHASRLLSGSQSVPAKLDQWNKNGVTSRIMANIITIIKGLIMHQMPY